VVSAPAFTLPLFIASLYGLYFTPAFDHLMHSSIGHLWMLVHFLAVGMFFFWPIIGVDPGPHRPGHLMRILGLFMGMPFHAFFGIAVMMAGQPLVDTFAHPPAFLRLDVLPDQRLAGGIAWAFSEVPSVLVLIALVAQWSRSEERGARRRDRAADRDGEAELAAYNAYLAALETRAHHGKML
jgi:cytochrome c oxidase assembly factor CtaG